MFSHGQRVDAPWNNGTTTDGLQGCIGNQVNKCTLHGSHGLHIQFPIEAPKDSFFNNLAKNATCIGQRGGCLRLSYPGGGMGPGASLALYSLTAVIDRRSGCFQKYMGLPELSGS